MPPEPTPTPTPSPTPTPTPTPDLKSLQDQLAALLKEKESWSKTTPPPIEDPSLTQKVKKDQEDKDKKNSESKELESALMFNLTSAEFIKVNESLLPKDIADIFKAAEKETYGSALEKANATKAAIIQSFYNQQENVDLLTPTQQSVLAEYLKLTKNGKEEKARETYDTIFEPILNMKKRVKKAEEISRSKSGYRGDSQGDSQYKEKLMALSKKHFLGEKV